MLESTWYSSFLFAAISAPANSAHLDHMDGPPEERDEVI